MGLNNDKNSSLIELKIELFKTCYFPGEIITGILILTPKPGITDAIFSDTKSHFTISERNYYKYKSSDQFDQYKEVLETKALLEKDIFFDQFLNENILLEMKIPFSIQLPTNAYPSCFFLGYLSYVSHNLEVEFPNLKTSANIMFIVKNIQYFTKENNLLKVPYEISKKIFKSKFLSSKGSFNIKIKLEKNCFFYDEQIIYEILLDFSELDLDANQLDIRIIKNIQKNYKNNHDKEFIKVNEDVAYQKFTLYKNNKKFLFKDAIKIDKKHNPSSTYENLDKNGPYELNKNKENKDFFLTPCCYGGLLSVGYILNIKLKFDSLLTFNEQFNIPLDLFGKQNNNVNNDIINEINNKFEEENNKTTIGGDNNEENNLNYKNNDGEDAPPPIINNK